MARLLVSIVFFFSFLTTASPLLPVYAACDPGSIDTRGCITKGITDANDGKSSTINLGGFGFSSINQATNTVISLLFWGAGILAFFYLLRGALMYVSAGEDAGQAGKARTMMTNALIGLIILAAVYFLWVLAIHLIPGLGQFFDVPNAGTQYGQN